MRFESEVHSGVRVVRVFGRWTGGPDDDSLKEQFRTWVGAGEKTVVMDMSQLELLNSIGLGRLVSYYTTFTREGGRISLAGLQERHRRAAYVARILDLFDDFESVDDAVAAVAKSNEGGS
jgi:anti-anti-sigma factor